jgi:hypothetical protein
MPTVAENGSGHCRQPSELRELPFNTRFPAYRDYKKQVPGLLRLPWKRLSASQAESLAQLPQKSAMTHAPKI